MGTAKSQHATKYRDKIYIPVLLIPALLFLVCISLLGYKSYHYANNPPPQSPQTLALIDQVALWFDPVFLQYNLALLTLTVAIVPLITFCYTRNMKGEKRRRLHRGVPPELLDDPSVKQYIEKHIKNSFHINHYLGSMLTLTLVVLMGSMTILLLKPMPLEGAINATGVDYRHGANFLMLGTYMEDYIQGDQDQYIRTLVTTLTAFQFGFLGAYIYFIGHLVRSYFTLDLTPNVFVSSSVRMITGSILALVLCYIIIDPTSVSPKEEMLLRGLPVWSFFIGFFPSRGLLFLEKISIKTIGAAQVHYFSTHLSNLPGMSYAHQMRLTREGYDNIENLANASALDLALRTGFSYPQLSHWISQAKLHEHLRDDYQSFLQGTGISSIDELEIYFDSYNGDDSADPVSLLASATGNKYEQKISVLYRLVKTAGQDQQY